MDDRTNREAPAVSAAEANGLETAGTTEQSQYNTNCGGSKAPDVAERLSALFDGNENGHHTFSGIAQEIATGKYKCCGVNFKDGPPTIEEWNRHLAGKSGIGVTAVRKDGRTKFGSIDLDTHGKNAYGFSCIDVADKIKNQKLPLILVKSNSGGLHLTVFFTEPVDAAMVRRVLRAWAISLGFPNAEVFPKQDVPNKDDNGSNLWMPYFGCFGKDSALPQQIGINLHGGAMDLAMFVTVAEQSIIQAIC
jgi:hypothetical protein